MESYWSIELVPGDIISIKLGDVVPADGRIISSQGGDFNRSSSINWWITSCNKEVGDDFSGSTCKQGEAEAIVISTGINTYFGRAAKLLVVQMMKLVIYKKFLAKIGNFCIVGIVIFIIAEILLCSMYLNKVIDNY